MSIPYVSVIIPVYGVEKYIKRCLESVINQTLKNIEIIIVNDDTKDNSMEICYEYAKIDSRIKVYNKENEGLGLTRNYGIERASGEYIAFIDSDDYVSLNMCEVLYDCAKKKNADVVYGGIYTDNNSGKIVAKPCVNIETIWKDNEIKDLLLDFIATEPNAKKDTIMEVSVWKALFRKSIFEENNIKFVSERQFISEDIIFDIDFFLNSKCIVAIPNCIYYYCLNDNSLTKVFRTDRFQKVKVLYKEIIRKLKGYYKDEEIYLRTDRFLIARARTNARQIIKNRNSIGKSSTNKALLEICNDYELQNILAEYSINKLPLKYFLVALLMKYKKIRLLKMILR